MRYITILLLCLHVSGASAQSDSLIKQFDRKKQKLNHTGMIVLSSWAGANIAGSAIGYGLTNSYGEKQFYIMNGAWGLINLGIALPGVFAKPKESAGIYELQKSQTKMEKIFLANAVLDVAYITGGVCLKQYSYNQSDIKKQQQFNGFGNSIMIQGAGLLIFDSFMTVLNNRHRKKDLDSFLQKATISFSGNYFKVGYRF